MQQVTPIGARIPKLSRFGWLMGLYAENHARLQRLFAPARLGEGSYLSSVGDGLDARQVETTHCYVGRRWQDVMGLYPPPAALVGHRLRMNTFLGKWLEYLAERGHGVATLVSSARCVELPRLAAGEPARQ
jgi:uncharacterized protein YqiB (DUF1249 family)